jgi:HD superfamily phosphohydrolase YqeK
MCKIYLKIKYKLKSPAAAVSQNAHKCSAVTWQDTKLHAHGAAAVSLLQLQDTKLHSRVAALLLWQVLKLKDEQICNNSG